MKIIALVGSIRRSSYNRKLAAFVQKRYAEKLDVTIPDLGALPFYDQDIELEAPEDVQVFKQAVMDADGVIFVTPEYNHSVPGVLENAIDWLSRVERPLIGKPAMILGATMGPLGTVRAQSHLRQVLDSPGVGMRILPGNEFLLSAVQDKMNAAGDITDSKVVEWLDHCVADYLKFANQLAVSD